MSNAASWPPAEITPQDFFEQWLPAEIARLRPATATPTPPLTTAVVLSGDDGGSWTLAATADDFAVSRGSSVDADLQVELSVDSWRFLLEQAAEHLPSDADPNALFTGGPVVAAAKAAKGSLSLGLTGFDGGEYSARVLLGMASEPAATVSVSKDTLDELRSGRLPAAQAFFAGRIALSGDTAFAMQLAMSLMAAAAN